MQNLKNIFSQKSKSLASNSKNNLNLVKIIENWSSIYKKNKGQVYPFKISNNKLFLKIPSKVYATDVLYSKESIMKRTNDVLGSDLIKNLSFVYDESVAEVKLYNRNINILNKDPSEYTNKISSDVDPELKNSLINLAKNIK